MRAEGSAKQTAALLVAGGVILGSSVVLARPGLVSDREGSVFRILNAGLGPLERPLWIVMQAGNGLSSVVVPVVLVTSGRSRADALRAAGAGLGAWQIAKAVKRLVPRPRPALLLDEVHLRDGNPGGGGFVSGHAAVSMATAVVVACGSSRPVKLGAFSTALVAGVARIHVGAHLPLDVVGGAALGLIWGSLCTRVPMPELKRRRR
ncbi:MAG: phosphatase PAP2 family protein [Microthrixaceae bacterium]